MNKIIALSAFAGLLAPAALAATPHQPAPPRIEGVQLAQIIPAQYTWGTIKAIDRDRGLLTLDNGVTYEISRNDLTFFQPGQQVDIAYIEEGQRKEIVTIRELGAKPNDRRIFPFSM